MKKLIELNVNSEIYEVAIDPHRSLLEVLRETIGLTGSKEGCGLGACGACTVLIDGDPALACLTLADRCVGHEILTIEGLAKPDALHPIQKAAVKFGAIQCGYCTPGWIMSSYSLLARNPKPTRDDIVRGIAGNLCRCTGYVKIIEAIDEAAKEMSASG
ncbi:MAG: (2Fe-2S)-binding protein [Thermodesulfobacteriota bacterium]